MQLCRVVGHAGDFLLPLRSARLHRALGKRRGAAACCGLLKNEHLFGAVFKCGIRSREARTAATAYDNVVFAVPLLGQTGTSGT